MSDRQYNLHEIIGRYVSGEITREEAEFLDREIQKTPSVAEFVQKNCIADFWLGHKHALDLEMQREIMAAATVPDELYIDGAGIGDSCITDPDVLLSELVRYEKAERPIPNKPIVVLHPPKANWLQRLIIPKNTERPPVRYSSRSNLFLLIRLLLLVGLFAFLSYSRNDLSSGHGPVAFDPKGRVTEVVDVVWGKDSPVYKRGQSIGTEPFTIREGLVQLVLDSGAELILESPGSYSLTGGMQCYCEQGKVNAHIPPAARGFEISSRHGRFIDRGTDFYLDVQLDKTDMGVVQGRVDYVTKEGTFQPLKQGQEIRVNESTAPHVTMYSITRYLDSKRFLPMLENYFLRRSKEKQEKHAQWDSNPHLLVRLDMDRNGRENIPNHSIRGRQTIAMAQPIKVSTKTGITPSGHSWYFDEDSSVRLDVPGSYESMTFMANVKIDRLHNMANVLFCGEDMGFTEGSILWQITKDGMLQLHDSKGADKVSDVYNSPVCMTRRIWGTWVNIAVVLDGKQRQIRHYVDGKKVAELPWLHPMAVKPGNGLIGNAWPNRTKTSTMNSYNLGCPMDSFMVFDSAMTEDEFEDYIINP